MPARRKKSSRFSAIKKRRTCEDDNNPSSECLDKNNSNSQNETSESYELQSTKNSLQSPGCRGNEETSLNDFSLNNGSSIVNSNPSNDGLSASLVTNQGSTLSNTTSNSFAVLYQTPGFQNLSKGNCFVPSTLQPLPNNSSLAGSRFFLQSPPTNAGNAQLTFSGPNSNGFAVVYPGPGIQNIFNQNSFVSSTPQPNGSLIGSQFFSQSTATIALLNANVPYPLDLKRISSYIQNVKAHYGPWTSPMPREVLRNVLDVRLTLFKNAHLLKTQSQQEKIDAWKIYVEADKLYQGYLKRMLISEI